MNTLLDTVEQKLADLFKNAPKIPEKGRKTLVEWMPWIAIIFGVLQIWAAWSLWRLGRRANEIIDGLSEFARQFGVTDTTPDLSLFYWVSLVLLAVSGVLSLVAYSGLKARKKVGWKWLFLAEIVNVVYGVFALFFDSYYGGGIGRLIWTLITAAIGFWLLFQIRDHYKS